MPTLIFFRTISYLQIKQVLQFLSNEARTSTAEGKAINRVNRDNLRPRSTIETFIREVQLGTVDFTFDDLVSLVPCQGDEDFSRHAFQDATGDRRREQDLIADQK